MTSVNSKRIQLVLWPRLWPWFFWHRYCLYDTDMTYIYRWVLYVWPLEIRRWETDPMGVVRARHHGCVAHD